MYLGEENVVELDERMTAEDFAYFSQKFLHAFTGLVFQISMTKIDTVCTIQNLILTKNHC